MKSAVIAVWWWFFSCSATAWLTTLPTPSTPQHFKPVNTVDWSKRAKVVMMSGMSSRRQVLSVSPAVIGAVGLGLLLESQVSCAAVGEGDLPETAAAFQRVLKSQREWDKIGSTISQREGKLQDDEWTNTQLFLRQTYLIGDDMKRLVRDADGEKRDKGIGIAKEFQKLTVDMEKPIKGRDWKAFLDQHSKGAGLYKDFISILSDVPDEL